MSNKAEVEIIDRFIDGRKVSRDDIMKLRIFKEDGSTESFEIGEIKINVEKKEI